MKKKNVCKMVATVLSVCMAFTAATTYNFATTVHADGEETETVYVDAVTVSPATLSLEKGKKEKLTATITPEDATDKTVTWSSADETIATVSATGEVTAVAAGTTVITATSENGEPKEIDTSKIPGSKIDEKIPIPTTRAGVCVVTVTDPSAEPDPSDDEVYVTAVTVTPVTSTIKEGETLQLTAKVMPDNATDKTVKWESSNINVATVNSKGVVTAIKEGSAVITATANNSISDRTKPSGSAEVVVIKKDEKDPEDPDPGKTDPENPTPSTQSGEKTIYRLYNLYTGEHFYTDSAAERDADVNAGWVYESEAWVSPEVSSLPVYRLYNPNNGDHHYTTNTAEVQMLNVAGWNLEGIGFYSNENKKNPVYRLYNPNTTGAGAHHYTKDYSEVISLTLAGWQYEGEAWFSL